MLFFTLKKNERYLLGLKSSNGFNLLAEKRTLIIRFIWAEKLKFDLILQLPKFRQFISFHRFWLTEKEKQKFSGCNAISELIIK